MADESSCLFCRIVRGEIPATVVFRENGVTAFRDIAPQAPTHILVVPDRHISGAAAITPADDALVGMVIRAAAEIARREGIESRGYRLVVNQGRDAGQSVDHLHVHLLGGRPLPTPLV
ncbi:MAG TPA: histidine triad nucleotide-binding protein [Chloroflexota bacterium]|nr:histidine triad nucleotide-binding protein [Chloroflexota bacterium]